VFRRQERLPRSVFLNHGKRFFSQNFSVTIPEKAIGYAVVVSKKTARLSVTRHRIKRKVIVALKDIKLPPALIIFPKSSITKMPMEDIKVELKKLLSKIAF